MKRTLKRIVNYGTTLLATGILSNAQLVKAQESDKQIDVKVSANLLDKNVFRGVAYSKYPVLQPNVYSNYRNFSANIWSNIDLKNRNLTEVDYTLEQSISIRDKLDTSLGYTLYAFPNPFEGNTQEFYTRIGLETRLNPTLTLVADFKQGKGLYGELSVGHEFKKGPNVSTILHYNGDYFREGNGLSHETAVLSKSFPVKGATLSPKLIITKSLSKDFEDEVYGGLNLSF